MTAWAYELPIWGIGRETEKVMVVNTSGIETSEQFKVEATAWHTKDDVKRIFLYFAHQ